MSCASQELEMRTGRKESGQAIVFVLLATGLFLFGAVAFAVDLSNMWFHRQAAQTAADAACMATAMDLLVDNQSAATGNQGFTNGTGFNCTTSSTAVPCQYASLNGYNSNALNPGNVVSVSFPSSVTGATTPSSGLAATPFVRVDVLDHVQAFFSPMVTGQKTQDVRAFAVCGTVVATSPIPILILRPIDAGTFTIQGTPTVAIDGGPSRSIQVNSSNIGAVSIGGNALIDLSKGGPPPSGSTGLGTGSDMGIFGGPISPPCTSPCKNWNDGSTGHWVAPSAPINDPFAQMAAPLSTSLTSRAGPIASGATGNGCPDPSGCYEYAPGYYSSGICVGKGGCTFKTYTTAIFDPGVYFVAGSFSADSNSCLRPSTATGDGTGGTMFYFSGTVNVVANSGSSCPATFSTKTGTGSIPFGVACDSTSLANLPTNLPTTLSGNVLLAPCTGTYGDPLVQGGGTDPTGTQRGILLFMDRSQTSNTANWGGGGSFILAGTMYFHSCNATGTGTSCGSTGTYFTDTFSLQGGSGSTTYVLGDIIADKITLGGNSGINMDLNPTVAFNILKATLLR